MDENTAMEDFKEIGKMIISAIRSPLKKENHHVSLHLLTALFLTIAFTGFMLGLYKEGILALIALPSPFTLYFALVIQDAKHEAEVKEYFANRNNR